MSVLLEIEVSDEEAEALRLWHEESPGPVGPRLFAGVDVIGLVELLAEAAAC